MQNIFLLHGEHLFIKSSNAIFSEARDEVSKQRKSVNNIKAGSIKVSLLGDKKSNHTMWEKQNTDEKEKNGIMHIISVSKKVINNIKDYLRRRRSPS